MSRPAYLQFFFLADLAQLALGRPANNMSKYVEADAFDLINKFFNPGMGTFGD